VNQIDSQLRELLEQAVGEPPRHISVPAVRRRVIHRRITQTAAAAVAVVAVAVGGTAVAAHFTGAVGGGAGPGAAGRSLPRYYLQVAADSGNKVTTQFRTTVTSPGSGGPRVTMTLLDKLVIRSTATGAVTGRIRCPEPAGWWIDENGIAAVNDRTFIVACMEEPAALKPDTDTSQMVLFRVRLTAAGRVAAVSPVPGGHISRVGAGVVSMAAATPDGREVALAISPGNSHMNIEVLNTVTGQRAIWRGPFLMDYESLSLTSDGQELVFSGARCLGVGRCTAPGKIMAVSPAARGGSLASARVIAGDVSQQAFAAVSPDGSTLAVLQARPGDTLTVQRISASTGRLLRTLYSRSGPGTATASFLSADPSGLYLIVNATISGKAVNGWIHGNQLVPLQPASRAIYWESW